MIEPSKSTVISANTFVDTGTKVLVVTPSYTPQPTGHYKDSYEREAAEVFMFLQEAFCSRTLIALKNRLAPYKDPLASKE